MISLFKLRKSEPNLKRPYLTPFYPAFPIIALVIATIAIIAMAIYNIELALIYVGIMAIAFLWFKIFVDHIIYFQLGLIKLVHLLNLFWQIDF